MAARITVQDGFPGHGRVSGAITVALLLGLFAFAAKDVTKPLDGTVLNH
jgi:hypothetical protein